MMTKGNFVEVWQWNGPNRKVDYPGTPDLEDKKWYFNTEDENYIGPYSTEDEADKACYEYAKGI